MENMSKTPTSFFTDDAVSFAENYGKKHSFNDRLALFLRAVQSSAAPPAKVLDFGCGPGVMSITLAKLGYCVTGLDGAEGMINVCRAKSRGIVGEGLQFEQVDAGNFVPRKAEFDVVVCSSVLEFVEDDLGLVKRLVQSLRPGGWFVVSVPQRLNIFTPLEPLAHAIKLRLSGRDEGHLAYSVHRYVKRRFLRDLRQFGLTDFRCVFFECPVLGGLGVKLSRFFPCARMLLVQGRRRVEGEPNGKPT